VPEDPLLAPLFANMSPDHPERVAAWLGETFGGPKRYTEDYGGYDRMVSQHLGKALTEEQRARWASLMIQSATEAGLPTDPEFRAAFVAYLEWGTPRHAAMSTGPPTPMRDAGITYSVARRREATSGRMERERRSGPGRDRPGRRSTASSRLPVVADHLDRRVSHREHSGVHVKRDSGPSSLTHVVHPRTIDTGCRVTGL
jgi:truncated hemoglobin YjbI